MYSNISFGKYYSILMGEFKDDFALSVSTYSIFLFYILFINLNVLR